MNGKQVGFLQPYPFLTQVLDSSKWKELADDIFKSDGNDRKFSKLVKKNTAGKGEIARYEQFLLFPQFVFKGLVLQTPKNQGLFGKGLTLYHTAIFGPI